jgi:hypothetical protein
MHLRTDQYTHVNRDCPMNIDMHPADNVVEIALGEHRIGEATLRLVVDHPDTFRRLTDILQEAQLRLVEHLRAKEGPRERGPSNQNELLLPWFPDHQRGLP